MDGKYKMWKEKIKNSEINLRLFMSIASLLIGIVMIITMLFGQYLGIISAEIIQGKPISGILNIGDPETYFINIPNIKNVVLPVLLCISGCYLFFPLSLKSIGKKIENANKKE